MSFRRPEDSIPGMARCSHTQKWLSTAPGWPGDRTYLRPNVAVTVPAVATEPPSPHAPFIRNTVTFS